MRLVFITQEGQIGDLATLKGIHSDSLTVMAIKRADSRLCQNCHKLNVHSSTSVFCQVTGLLMPS